MEGESCSLSKVSQGLLIIIRIITLIFIQDNLSVLLKRTVTKRVQACLQLKLPAAVGLCSFKGLRAM